MDLQLHSLRHYFDRTIFFMVVILVTSHQILSFDELPKIYTDGWSSIDTDFRTWNTNETAPLGPGTNESTYVVPSSVTGLSLFCNASYPIEWYFHREKWGRRATWQIWVTTSRVSDPSTLTPIAYTSEIRFLGSDIQITGNYTCQAYGKTEISRSVYVFWEGSGTPFLTLSQSKKKLNILFNNKKEDYFRLPCTTSRPDTQVELTKIYQENITTVLNQNQSITFDPTLGYTLKYLSDPLGHYRCTVGDTEDNDFVDFEVIAGDDEPLPEFGYTKWKRASFEYDSDKRQFICCSNNNKPPRMKNYDCNHPITCKLRKHVLHDMESNHQRLVNGNCAMIKLYRHGLYPGVLRCVGDSIDLVQEYFFPFVQASKNETLKPYYSWSDADPMRMMKLSDFARPFYIGQSKRFDCQISPFYYSDGIHWSVKYNNEKSYSIKGNRSRSNRRHPFELFIQVNHAYLLVKAEEGLESITCHAPVWNTTEWKNMTLKFDIRKPIKPTVEGPSVTEIGWRLNVTNKTLNCEFHGEPTPLVRWMKGNTTIRKNVVRGNGSSTLKIPRVGLETPATYTCNVSNVGGYETRIFNVAVSVGVSTEVVALYVFAVLCTIGAVVGGFFVFTKIQEQKEAIRRLANVAFKDVTENPPPLQSQQHFPELGNQFPAVLPNNGNGFSNHGFLNNIANDASAPDFGRYHQM